METVWWWIGGIVGGGLSLYNLWSLWSYYKYLRQGAKIREAAKRLNDKG